MSQSDELTKVMRETADAMNARGAVLMTYYADAVPQTVHAGNDAGVTDDMLSAVSVKLREVSRQEVLQAPVWLTVEDAGETRDVMCLPVQPIDSHGQLLVVVFFDRLNRTQRETAEEVYLRRRPFAIGYFRLWQLERSHRRQLAGLTAALDLLDMGIILIDRGGRVAFANPVASALLETQQGVRYQGSRLVTTDLRSSVKLQVAIDHVLAESAAGAVVRRAPIMTIERANAPALIATIFPASGLATDEPGSIAAILYLVDPRMDADRVLQPICRLHGLSPLETRLVCLLAAGATLSEAAQRMNVKEQTVRGSLKQVFIKTGTHRQSDLVRLMLTSVVRTTPSVTPEVL